jgi:hypothetical protein
VELTEHGVGGKSDGRRNKTQFKAFKEKENERTGVQPTTTAKVLNSPLGWRDEILIQIPFAREKLDYDEDAWVFLRAPKLSQSILFTMRVTRRHVSYLHTLSHLCWCMCSARRRLKGRYRKLSRASLKFAHRAQSYALFRCSAKVSFRS